MPEEKEIRYANRLCPCPAYDVEGMESWLTDMAAQGLHLSPDGFFGGLVTFEQGDKKNIRYRLQGEKRGTGIWAENGGTPDSEAIAIGVDMGWEYVAKRGGFTVWRCEDPAAREMNTDPEVQAIALKALRSRQRDNIVEIILWSILWPLFYVRGCWLLTMIAMDSRLFLFGCALILWTLVDSVRSLIHLGKLAAQLKQGEALSHRSDWKKRALRYRIGRIVQILCIAVWVVLILRSFLMSAANKGEIPLSEFTGEVPFATMADFAPGGEYTLGGYMPANGVTFHEDILVPVSISWHEQAEIIRPDGTTLEGGLFIEYHEAASESIAARLAKEHHIRGRSEKHYEELSLSLPDLEYTAAFVNHLHYPTVVLQKGKTVIRAYFWQIDRENGMDLAEWAAILAQSME